MHPPSTAGVAKAYVTMLCFLCGPRKLSSGPHALNPPSISLVHFSHLTCKQVKGWGTAAGRRDKQPQAQLRRQPARATQHLCTSCLADDASPGVLGLISPRIKAKLNYLTSFLSESSARWRADSPSRNYPLCHIPGTGSAF